jgi:hypothetical protein
MARGKNFEWFFVKILSGGKKNGTKTPEDFAFREQLVLRLERTTA